MTVTEEVSWVTVWVKRLNMCKELRTLIENSLTHRIVSCSSLGPSSLFFHRQNRGLLTIWWAHLLAPVAQTSTLMKSGWHSLACEARNHLAPAPEKRTLAPSQIYLKYSVCYRIVIFKFSG